MLVQVMGGEGADGKPTFYDDHTRILVNPTRMEVFAEVDRVYAQDCPHTASSSSSLPDAFPVGSFNDDGNDNLYAWRVLYTFSAPKDSWPAWMREKLLVVDEAAVAAEMLKQDSEVAAAVAAATATAGGGKKK